MLLLPLITVKTYGSSSPIPTYSVYGDGTAYPELYGLTFHEAHGTRDFNLKALKFKFSRYST